MYLVSCSCCINTPNQIRRIKSKLLYLTPQIICCPFDTEFHQPPVSWNTRGIPSQRLIIHLLGLCQLFRIYRHVFQRSCRRRCSKSARQFIIIGCKTLPKMEVLDADFAHLSELAVPVYLYLPKIGALFNYLLSFLLLPVNPAR